MKNAEGLRRVDAQPDDLVHHGIPGNSEVFEKERQRRSIIQPGVARNELARVIGVTTTLNSTICAIWHRAICAPWTH